jgi:predicted transcriptional regulator
MGRFLGILREESVEGAVSEGRPAVAVRDVLDARADEETFVPRDLPIDQLLGSEPLRRLGALMVVDAEQRLCGVVTLEQVRRALAAAVPSRLA